VVEFELKVNEKQGTMYMPKWVRDAWGHDLKIRPDTLGGMIYPCDIPLEDVMEAMKVILLDMKHDIILRRRVAEKAVTTPIKIKEG